MYLSIIIVFLTISFSSAKSLIKEKGDLNQNDSPLLTKITDELYSSVDSKSENDFSYNRYFLFTRRNTILPNELVMNDASSIISSNFDPNNPTFVIVHGWTTSYIANLNTPIREALLNKGEYNVINMDWSKEATESYVSAVTEVPRVGIELGRFIRFLSATTSLDLAKVHFVGYSLGAHVVGNAGRELNGQVGRVTGLDPAGPLWRTNDNKMSKIDGIYVEAIHTDGGYLIEGQGIGFPIADVDFFPNGGFNQPGCTTSFCNHERSWILFTTTLIHNHLIGQKCNRFVDAIFNSCHGEELPLGNDDLNKTGNGVYRINTQDRYPF